MWTLILVNIFNSEVQFKSSFDAMDLMEKQSPKLHEFNKVWTKTLNFLVQHFFQIVLYKIK